MSSSCFASVVEGTAGASVARTDLSVTKVFLSATWGFSVAVIVSFAFSATWGSSGPFSFCTLAPLGDGFNVESAAFLVASVFFLAPMAFELALLLLELEALLLREDEEPDELLPDELDELVELEE